MSDENIPDIDPLEDDNGGETEPEIVQRLTQEAYSLEDLFGEDWRQRSFREGIDQVLTPEELAGIRNSEPILRENIRTSFDQALFELNILFEELGYPYSAIAIDRSQKSQKALISGNIGEDTFYQIVEHLSFSTYGDSIRNIVWSPAKAGFVSRETGRVFNIHDFLNIPAINQETETPIHYSFVVNSGNNSEGQAYLLGATSILPQSLAEMEEFIYQLSQGAINRKYSEQEGLIKNRAIQKKYLPMDFNTEDRAGEVTQRQSRELEARLERSTHAVALYLLREINREMTLQYGSNDALKWLLVNAIEPKLQVYDTTKYLRQFNQGRRIPAYSKQERIASRILDRELAERNLTYYGAPNFDDVTGENIAGQPSILLRKLRDLEGNT